jgi:hypothetical protein
LQADLRLRTSAQRQYSTYNPRESPDNKANKERRSLKLIGEAKMRHKFGLGLLVISLCSAGFAQKKQADLPRVLTSAQYVYVETIYGSPFSRDPRITPQDRQAVSDVVAALDKWGRYKVTLRRSEADLVFVIHRKDIGSVGGAVRFSPRTEQRGCNGGETPASGNGGMPPQPDASAGPVGGCGGTGTAVFAEAGTPGDVLSIYFRNTFVNNESVPVWQKVLRNGLAGPNLPLFKEFKDQLVAADARLASQHKKP